VDTGLFLRRWVAHLLFFRHSHGGMGCESAHKPFLAFLASFSKPFQHRIPRRILPIPPPPAVFGQRVIHVGAIKQEHLGKGTPVLVLAVNAFPNIRADVACFARLP